LSGRFLDALDDLVRRPSSGWAIDVEPLDVCARLIVGDARYRRGVAHDVGQDAAGVHHGKAYRREDIAKLVGKLSEKTLHREFRAE